MRHVAIGGAILFALAIILGAFPVAAAPAKVGDTYLPEPSIICIAPGIIDRFFEGTRDPAVVGARIRAAKTVTVNGKPACAIGIFRNAPTVIGIAKIGGVDFEDGRESDAYVLHLRFDDGDEVYYLDFEAIPGKGA